MDNAVITDSLSADALARFVPPEGASRAFRGRNMSVWGRSSRREKQRPPAKGAGSPGGDALQDWALGFFPAWQTPQWGAGCSGTFLSVLMLGGQKLLTCQVIYY